MPSVHDVHKVLASFGAFDTGTGRGAKRIMARGLCVASLIGVAMVAGIAIATVPHKAANKAYWTVSGPPCPTATHAEILRIHRPLAQVVEFGEGHFARMSGAVDCTDLTDSLGMVTGTTCQFAGPRALWVSSEGGSSYFDIRYGGPATVTVSRTRPPVCVLAAHYRGD